MPVGALSTQLVAPTDKPEVPMTFEVPAHGGKPASRIRQKNEETISQAAEDEFARHGYKGTSMNTIAQNAGLPKANLHYYFTNKLGCTWRC
jgi:TetR/AcrR family transcriptional regulator